MKRSFRVTRAVRSKPLDAMLLIRNPICVQLGSENRTGQLANKVIGNSLRSLTIGEEMYKSIHAMDPQRRTV